MNISQKTKRIIAAAVVAVFVGCVVLTAGLATYVPRSQTLRILSLPGDIMPRSVVESFEKQVRKQASGKFRVKYEVAQSNDMIYDLLANKKNKEKNDYDLVCVSEQMAEKLFVNELLLPINTQATRYAPEVMNPINKIFSDRATDAGYESSADVAGKIFAIPYLYGTSGIMANPKKIFYSNADGKTTGTTGGVTLEPGQLEQIRVDMKSWAVLWDAQYTGKISMKNVARYSYTAALLYHFKNEMNPELLERIMQEAPGVGPASNGFLKAAGDALKAQEPLRSNQYGYEISAGKSRMADTRLSYLPAIGLYWSSEAGEFMPKNKDLEFYVPDEGGALWVDSWVMPAGAKNKTAALNFINFISEKNNAIKIMKQTNCASAVLDARTQMRNDLKTKYADEEEWVDRYLTALLPDNTVLDRCGLLRYLGEASDTSISNLWEEVKK